MAPVLIGMFLLGSIQLIFIGLMGEYILSMNQRLLRRPLVIEEERINFTAEDASKPPQHAAGKEPQPDLAARRDESALAEGWDERADVEQ